MEFEFLIDDVPFKLSLEKRGSHFIVSDGAKTFEADIQCISPNLISIMVGDRSSQVSLARDKDKLFLYVDGHHFVIREPSREGFQRGEEKSQEDILIVKAPMPGKVIKVNVAEKDEVRRNQTLAIVEAMKMENEIKSSIEGYVKKIFISPGDLVDSDKPLIELEPK